MQCIGKNRELLSGQKHDFVEDGVILFCHIWNPGANVRRWLSFHVEPHLAGTAAEGFLFPGLPADRLMPMFLSGLAGKDHQLLCTVAIVIDVGD
jgi:hypothetical protein